MKNIEKWQPSIIYKVGDEFKVNYGHISYRSRLAVKLSIGHYISKIREYANGNLLDLGCGTVPYYEVYKDLVDDVKCTDWENSMHVDSHLDVVSNLNEAINFKDKEFDTIIFTDVLEHLSRPELVMSEINRVLKKGGIVVLAVPFIYNIHEEPHDIARYTRFGIADLAEKSGLEVVEIEEIGGALTIIGDILGKIIPIKSLSILVQWLFGMLLKTRIALYLENKTKKKLTRSYLAILRKE